MGDAAIRFGTDGWRGVIARDFTFDRLRRVAAATAECLLHPAPMRGGVHESPRSREVLVGFDRRFLSESFAGAVAEEFQRKGFRVLLSRQPLPTPCVSVNVVHRKGAAGIAITASHNPPLYNGLKIKDASGRSAPPEFTQRVEEMIRAPSPISPTATATREEGGRVIRTDFTPPYLAYVRHRLDWKVIRTLRGCVVLDHLHGATAGFPEKILAKSRLKCLSLHSEWDPLFGGLRPEPIEENLPQCLETTRRRHALLGLAFDGDGDRLGVCDERGRYLSPHQVFPLLLLYLAEIRKEKGKVVQTVSLGALSERIAQAYNLEFEELPVGFKHVAQRMLEEDILLGGEESGGYAIRGGLPERDGILSGLLLLELLGITRAPLSALVQEMERVFGRSRFRRRDIPLPRAILDKTLFANAVSHYLPDRLVNQAVKRVRTDDGVKVFLESGAWVLLRPSGTEPLLRTYAETDSIRKTDQLLTWAGDVARRIAESQNL